MSSYRVLVVTNLWPYEGDPSYSCAVQAQMERLHPVGVETPVPHFGPAESPGRGAILWPLAAALVGRQFPRATSPLQRATPVDHVLVKPQDAPLPPRGSFFLKKRRCHS
jgi:hypothetical protein